MIIFINGKQREVATDAPLLEVLDQFDPGGSPTQRGRAVAVDGSVVPRANLGVLRLHEGARIEIVTAVQGG